jgi:hypothetical protein
MGGGTTTAGGTLNFPRFSALPLSPAAGLGGAGAEIPLREPLDIEFKLNRKLAKQLYEKEMQDKTKLNLHTQQLAKEQELAARLKKEQEKAKKQDEALESMKAERDELKLKKQEKLRAAHVSREHAMKLREADLRKLEKQTKERLAKLAEDKEDRARKAQEDAFLRDIEHQREKHDKNGEGNLKAKVRGLIQCVSLKWC